MIADREASAGGSLDAATWSADGVGTHAIDRELQRELVRAGLFADCPPPRIGRFVVVERLGAGASAVVYAALDERLARRVAIKIFVARSSATRERVLREARALARLSHRNVVPVYEDGEWNDHAFIAMELVAGTTLAQWQAEPARTTEDILDAYLQAGQGLAAAHRAGLVHRDFKPTNVMVAADGRVVVTDFGVVGADAPDAEAPASGGAGEPTAAGTSRLVGTPAYMAPEQRAGAPPRPSADVYSFSLSLCEALLGRYPFAGDEPRWQRALADRVPRRVRAAIRAGLADDPDARGASLEPLLRVLASGSRARRSPLLIAAIILVSALASATATLAIVELMSGSAPEPPPRRLTAQIRRWSHLELTQQVEAVVVSPPRDGDTAAETAVRSLALRPLPVQIHCAWPSKPVATWLGPELVATLDRDGRVHACTLAGGAISPVTSGARCITGGDGAIGVIDQTGELRAFRPDGDTWAAIPTSGRAEWMAASVERTRATSCPFSLRAERDGTFGLYPARWLMAVDHSRRFAVLAGRHDVRVIGDGGSVLADAFRLDSTRVTLSVMASLLPVLATARLSAGRAVLLDISRDGSRALAMMANGPLLWWQAGSDAWREEPARFRSPSIRQARLSPSGLRALIGDAFGGLDVYTLGGGRAAGLTSGPLVDAVFADDDTVLAIDPDARVWRWDLAEQRAGVHAIHDDLVWAIDRDAQIDASAGEDGAVFVVDHQRGTTGWLHPAGRARKVYSLLLDDDHLVAGTDDGLRMWAWRGGTSLPVAAGGIHAWAVAATTALDGSRVYVSGGLLTNTVSLWRASDRTQITPPSAGSGIHEIAIIADGQTAAAITRSGALILVDLAARQKVREVPAHPGGGRRIAFDAVTETLVTCGGDGYLRTWLPTGELRHEVLLHGDVIGLDVRRGRAVTASSTGGVALVDLATGAIVRQFERHPTSALSARFSPDRRWFVTGDASGGVCLWHVDQPRCHAWLEGHTDAVNIVRFSPDGATILTGSNDGTVRWWRPTYDMPIRDVLEELARHGARR